MSVAFDGSCSITNEGTSPETVVNGVAVDNASIGSGVGGQMTILGISPVLIGNFAGTLCSLLTLFDCGLGTFSMLMLGPRILLLIFTSSQVASLPSLSVPLSVTLISSTESTSTSSALRRQLIICHCINFIGLYSSSVPHSVRISLCFVGGCGPHFGPLTCLSWLILQSSSDGWIII